MVLGDATPRLGPRGLLGPAPRNAAPWFTPRTLLGLACAAMLLSRADAATLLSWVPSIVDHASPGFREAFPLQPVAVERVAGKVPGFQLDAGGRGSGKLVLQGGMVRFHRLAGGARQTGPALVISWSNLALVEFEPALDFAEAAKKAHLRANPNSPMRCVRLAVKAESLYPGDTHTMVLCTDVTGVMQYFRKAGEWLRKVTVRSNAGYDHEHMMDALPSTLFKGTKAYHACEEIRYSAVVKQAKKWTKQKKRIYERAVGPSYKFTAANNAVYNNRVHVFRVGDRMRISAYLTGNSEQSPNGVVVSIRGTESTAEYQADLELLQDAFKERFRALHEGKYALSPVLKAALKFGRAALATSDDYMRFLREFLSDFVAPVLRGAPKAEVYLCGHSLGGFMAQMAALYLADDFNAKTFVVTTSAPGAAQVYRARGQQLFNARPVNPFSRTPTNMINMVSFYDWIPKLGRQPGTTCISTFEKTRVGPQQGQNAGALCPRFANLQFADISEAFGQCFVVVHNRFDPGTQTGGNTPSYWAVTCCAAGTSSCGIYKQLPRADEATYSRGEDADEKAYGAIPEPPLPARNRVAVGGGNAATGATGNGGGPRTGGNAATGGQGAAPSGGRSPPSTTMDGKDDEGSGSGDQVDDGSSGSGDSSGEEDQSDEGVSVSGDDESSSGEGSEDGPDGSDQ